MAGARHPVCVSGAALVQTDRLQVGAHGTPASPRGGGELTTQRLQDAPTSPAGVRLLVLVKWQRRLRLEAGGTSGDSTWSATRLPQQPDPREMPTPCPCAHSGFQPRDPCLPSQGNLVGPRRPMMPLLAQKTLKETFPVEAGLLRRSDRVLPKLPGQASRDPGGWGRQQWDVRSLGGAHSCPVLPAADAPWLVLRGRTEGPCNPPAAAGGLPKGAAGGRGACVPQPGAHWLLRATTSGLGAYAATWRVPARGRGRSGGEEPTSGKAWAGRACGRHLTPLPCPGPLAAW